MLVYQRVHFRYVFYRKTHRRIEIIRKYFARRAWCISVTIHFLIVPIIGGLKDLHTLCTFLRKGQKWSSKGTYWMTNLLKYTSSGLLWKPESFKENTLPALPSTKPQQKNIKELPILEPCDFFFGHFLQQRLDEKPLALRKFFESSVMVVVNEEIWSSCSSRKRSLWADSEVVTLDLQLNKRHHDSIFFK